MGVLHLVLLQCFGMVSFESIQYNTKFVKRHVAVASEALQEWHPFVVLKLSLTTDFSLFSERDTFRRMICRLLFVNSRSCNNGKKTKKRNYYLEI